MAPRQKPGRSRQDYSTPPDFLQAVKWKLGIDHFTIDLAASHENTVAPIYISEAQNALETRWITEPGWGWLNPPFGHITPWLAKAYVQSLYYGARVVMLVPASTGANWWRDWVHDKAYVLFLNGRLTFVGHTAPYPKDCALLLFTNYLHGGYGVWRWRDDVAQADEPVRELSGVRVGA